MPEHADSSLSRRGAWIGLRTLRQRPKVVDHTSAGEPIFEVRSVRLVLHPDADHFNRLETCSKCGRNVPGGPVFDLADLDRPSNPLICTTCVQAVAKPTLLRPGVRRPEAPPPARKAPAPPEPKADLGDRPAPAPADAARQRETAAPAADDVRQDLQTVTRLLEAQQRELATLSAAVRETRAELRSATESHGTLAQTQRELGERMVAMAEHSEQAMSGGGADAAAERDLRHNLQFVTELLQAQQRELSSLAATLVETRNDLHAVTESHQTLARSQFDLEQRLVELAQAKSPEEGAARPAESLARDLEDMRARLAEGLGQARADAATMVAQLRADVGALAEAVEDQLHRFESTGDAGARAHLSDLTQAVNELRTSSRDNGGRLEALQRELEEVVARLSRSEAVERTPSPAWGDDAGAPPEGPARGHLLDVLERQLQDAEGRLAKLSGPSYEST